jgi:3-oxoadipate enol-lactonase
MLGAADLRPKLGAIACPATVIVGEEDYATPIAAARSLQEGIGGSDLVVLQVARHFTPFERPDDIAAALVALAARLRAAARPANGETVT